MIKIPSNWHSKIYSGLSWAAPLLALLLISLVYFLGVYTERTGFVREVLDPGLKRITDPVLNAFRGGVPPVNTFYLQLDSASQDSLQKLGELQPHVLNEIDTMRLKGTGLWNDLAVNFIIHAPLAYFTDDLVKSGQAVGIELLGDTIQGMQRFNLLPAKGSNVLYDRLMQNALIDQKLPAFGLVIAEVKAPWKKKTLSVLFGMPDSVTLSNWPIGHHVVGAYSDELMRAVKRSEERSDFNTVVLPQADWFAAPLVLEPMHSAVLDSPARKVNDKLLSYLENFRKGAAPTSLVFENDHLAKLFALSDLFGQQNTINWWNMRFVLDSVSQKMIAVPLTYGYNGAIAGLLALNNSKVIEFPAKGNTFADRAFSDPEFYRCYIAYLDTFSADGWLEDLFLRNSVVVEQDERLVNGYFTDVTLDRSVFDHNRLVIHSTLYPNDLLLAYSEDRTGQVVRLAIGNVHALPVEVLAYVVGTDTIPLDRPVVLPPRKPNMPLTYVLVEVKVPQGATSPDHLVTRPYGLSHSTSVKIGSWNSFPAGPVK